MYSQNNEEEVIKAYFNHNKNLRFLDIGANDGQTLSNTAYLSENGWGGVCIEPDDVPFEKLYLKYAQSKKVKCYNLALGKENKTADFWKSGNLLSDSDSGLVSTLHQSETARFRKSVKYEKSTTEVYTWQDFLSTYKVNAQFAFVSIDAEGSDLEILEQMDLGAMGVQMLCVEWNGLAHLALAYTKICNTFALHEISRNAENIIFAK